MGKTQANMRGGRFSALFPGRDRAETGGFCIMNESLQRYERWRAQADLDPAVAAELAAIEGDEAAVTDRFYRDLAFGTGGFARRAGRGHQPHEHLHRAQGHPGPGRLPERRPPCPKRSRFAHDSRHNGDVFAREDRPRAGGQRHHGLPVPRGLEPTPALSWAVRYLGCGAGRLRDGVPQPGQIQRLQGLRRGRLPDHAGSGGKDPGRHRGRRYL